jgi:hypothetical protein
MNTGLAVPCEEIQNASGIYEEIETLNILTRNTSDLIETFASRFSPILLESIPSDTKAGVGVLCNTPEPIVSPVESRLKEIQEVIINNNMFLSDILSRCRL